MKSLRIILSLTFFIAGCARAPLSIPEPVAEQTAPRATKSRASTPRPREGGDRRAVWELLSARSLTLFFHNIESKKSVNVTLQRGLNVYPLPVGDWELTGLSDGTSTFMALPGLRRFVFNMASVPFVYAGSIVVGCPKVDGEDLRLLKVMSFFNRYPFAGDARLCEVVVGNDLKGAQERLRLRLKNKKLSLRMGL